MREECGQPGIGGDVLCQVQDAGIFGDCAMSLGAMFDGTQCVPVHGCECQGEGGPRFDSLETCAQRCAEEGWYQPSRMPLICPGVTMSCTEEGYAEFLGFCDTSKTNPEARLRAIMPDFSVRCTEARESVCIVPWVPYECIVPWVPYEESCQGDDWCCTGWNIPIDAHMRHLQVRAMSLLPSVKQGGVSEWE